SGAVERGRRVLILVHRRELIRQASAKLTHAGVDHGIIAAGFPASEQLVQVASVQTLVRRLERIAWAPDLIVIDEAHHAVAGSWSTTLAHWPQAYRLGVTATPVRRDGRGLGAMFDRLVLGPSVQQLTAQGFITPARIYAPAPKFQSIDLRVRSGDYAPEAAAEQIDRPTVTGDAIEHYQRLGRGCSAIAFCCTTQHAEHVSAQFRACGIRSHVILGTTPVEERERLIDDLGTGALQVLVSVDVISEGTDVPSVGAAILLRPTQSEGLYLQQVGRVLRPAPGKTHALILDHVGNVHRHGFPDDLRKWSLEDTRRRARGGGPPAPSVRTCPSCFAAFRPQLLCPVCGTYTAPPARELRQVDGELQELKRVNAQLRRREQGKAQSLQQLIALGQARGMKNPVGWAKHVYFARQRAAQP
ncbi:MAG: DEAD/DEAH box helicase, partial [Cyanobium sp.]|nr:DEAD/DEAH box helicase [Cyanobium sp.]